MFAVLGLALLAACPSASAQDYPSRPIRLVVGYPAGGVNDIIARVLGQPLAERLGQPVVIDNRPGANSVLGAENVARSAPDGYTLFSTGTPFAINASLYKNLPYDPLKDFVPVAQVASGTFLLVVHPSLPVNSPRELIDYARAHPGQLNFCSSGPGSPPHLMGELLNQTAGIKMVHIPYKGAAPCVADLLGGQIQVTFEAMAPLLPHIKSGKLRALAVMSDHRSPVLPDLPTMAEATGYPALKVDAWYGVLAPKGTPAAIVAKLNNAL
ncbi:MAG TPA: tripartite tricarboxylate transporter substrate binding protein, partial [Burkholderiales bacterium]|nr:tripartite tricarboxylate transporter substrate binding protein [Burkholderiales bacterium]